MKKTTKRFIYYLLCWAILLALFNIISFVTPGEIAGVSKYTGSFWTGYVCIIIAFLGQLACAFFTFREENLSKLFYNVPLINISYIGTVATVIVGSICMAIPNLPNWVGITLCAVILAITAVAAVMAKAAADEIGDVDRKIKVQTFFINSMSVDAQTLLQSAQSDVIKNECEKVYEAVRFSDPISNPALSSEETHLKMKFNDFSLAVKTNDEERVLELTKMLLVLIDDRNRKCKLLK